METTKSHSFGDENAPIVIIEYGDVQCPYTARAATFVDEVLQRRGDEVRYEFRHFPLVDLHEHAWDGALATEAAGRQGKFWEMLSLLFDNQQALDEDDLLSYAAALDLDVDEFASDMGSDEVAAAVERDLARGERDGVDSTPTFVINGVRFDGDAADLEQAIDEVVQERRPSA